MEPTPEQDFAIACTLTNRDVKIEAGAGSGKTSTLKAASVYKSGQTGTYVTFSAAMAAEAKSKFPDNVKCASAHSLAMWAVGRPYSHRLNGRLTAKIIVEALKLEKVGFVPPFGIATFALNVVKNFTQSERFEVSRSHFPEYLFQKNEEVQQAVLLAASRLWQILINPSSQIPITHDVYLKLWALNNPKIASDYILSDESQDINGALLSIIKNQQAQKIYVGDQYQQIYAWRGALNAMQSLETAFTCYITKSFRFGQPIANLANCVLNNFIQAKVNFKGWEELHSEICEIPDPDVILARTNATLLGRLMSTLRKDPSSKIHIAGGVGQLIALIKAANQLREGGKTYFPDLAAFDTWRELIEYAESEIGQDLRPLVKLMEMDNINDILKALEGCDRVKEVEADLVLSTAHKSKGREWKRVKLANDFQYPQPGENGEVKFNPEEARLLYVAVTRAEKKLDITQCDAAQEALLLNEEKEKNQSA